MAEDDVRLRPVIAAHPRDCGYGVIEAAGSVPRAVVAAADLCEEGALPKPYEPQSVHDRIGRLPAARPADKI